MTYSSSEYIALDDALNDYGLTRGELQSLIDTIVYARPLPPGADGQPCWEIHRESLDNAFAIEQISREFGPRSPATPMATNRAATQRLRLAQADGQPITTLQADLIKADDLTAQQYEETYGEPPPGPQQILARLHSGTALPGGAFEVDTSTWRAPPSRTVAFIGALMVGVGILLIVLALFAVAPGGAWFIAYGGAIVFGIFGMAGSLGRH